MKIAKEYKYVQLVKTKGNIYYYYRHKGRRIKLSGAPGSTEFEASYETASGKHKTELSGFRSVIADYYGSTEFQAKSSRTQSDYLKYKSHIEEKWANVPVRLFDDKRIRQHIKQWHKGLVISLGARQGDLAKATFSVVLSYAVDNGVLSHNYAKGIQGAYSVDRSDMIWTKADVETFMKKAPKGLRLALILALHLGRREGDLIRLTWGDYTGTHIHVTNRKRGRKAKFAAKCTDALKATLDAYKRSLTDGNGTSRIPAPEEPILTTPKGLPWVESHFSTKFSKAKNSAGLTELHFHDLRGTAITTLAEQGTTHAEIASISGHSTKDVARILDKYLSLTASLNESATIKLNESWIASVGSFE